MTKRINARIAGWGKYLPSRVVSNDDIARRASTSSHWIVERTGIYERRFAEGDETNAYMASRAAMEALSRSHIDIEAIDRIIVATSTPDSLFPSTAAVVQHMISAHRAHAFDISAACSGFIYALAIAKESIESGSCKCVLVIGVETYSRVLDFEDRDTAVLFGDGAGAVVLEAGKGEGSIDATTLHTEGDGGNSLYLPCNGTIRMRGRDVFRFAIRALCDGLQSVADAVGCSCADFAVVIPHQSNIRIIRSAAEKLGLPLNTFVINVDRYGNTGAASIPIALAEAADDCRFEHGQRIALVGFGAGLTWGAATLTWPYEQGRINGYR